MRACIARLIVTTACSFSTFSRSRDTRDLLLQCHRVEQILPCEVLVVSCIRIQATKDRQARTLISGLVCRPHCTRSHPIYVIRGARRTGSIERLAMGFFIMSVVHCIVVRAEQFFEENYKTEAHSKDFKDARQHRHNHWVRKSRGGRASPPAARPSPGGFAVAPGSSDADVAVSPR